MQDILLVMQHPPEARKITQEWCGPAFWLLSRIMTETGSRSRSLRQSTGYKRRSFLWLLPGATHLLKPSILHISLTLIIFWSFSRFTGKGEPGRVPRGCQISIQHFNCNELQWIFSKSVSSCFFGVSGTQYKSQLAQVLQAENVGNTYGNTFAWCCLFCTPPKRNIHLCCSIKGENLQAWSNVYNSIIHEIQSCTLITFMFNFQD